MLTLDSNKKLMYTGKLRQSKTVTPTTSLYLTVQHKNHDFTAECEIVVAAKERP